MNHSLLLQSTLQAFLARILVIAENQKMLAAYHRYFISRNIFESEAVGK